MFSPQTRINRFVFLNLSVLSLEVHLGVTASPHTPFPHGLRHPASAQQVTAASAQTLSQQRAALR